MNMTIQNWSELSDKQINLDAIKELHVPNEDFIFRVGGHNAGATSIGGTSGTFVYALQGSCRYWESGLEEQALEVREGQRLWISSAPVSFSVGKEADFRYVIVLPLPEDLRGRGFR